MTPDPLKPSISLLCKLGSAISHAEELISPEGRVDFDIPAFKTVAQDPEVVEWLEAMRKMALISVRRTYVAPTVTGTYRSLSIDEAVEQGKLAPHLGEDAKNLGYSSLESYLDEECK